MGLISDFKADLRQEYGIGKRHIKLFSIIFNPSMRACFLIRACLSKHRMLYLIFRNVLIALHGIDIGRGTTIEAPLILPHPTAIVIGKGVRIGSGVTLFQGVTIGAKRGGYPSIGRGVTIYPNSVVVGAITIGDNSTIGALSFIDKNVEPSASVRGNVVANKGALPASPPN